MLDCYHRLASREDYAPSSGQVAARSLRNTCREFLSSARDLQPELAPRQFSEARNMTDRLAVLRAVVFFGDEARREQALDQFHRDWRHDALVMNQWFAVQAAMPLGDTLARVQGLLSHPDFDLRNPDKVRSLVGVFAGQTPAQFHGSAGGGSRFLPASAGHCDR